MGQRRGCGLTLLRLGYSLSWLSGRDEVSVCWGKLTRSFFSFLVLWSGDLP